MSNIDITEPDVEARDLLGKAKTDMVIYMPFFASLALRLYYKQSSEIDTAGVDGISFFYNPDFIKGLSHKQRLFLMIHESLHCALSHMTRCQERDKKKFNAACDYVINLMIEDYNKDNHMRSLTEPPSKILLDEKYRGLSAEEVYPLLDDLTGDQQEAGAWGAVMPAPDSSDKANNPNGVTPGELEQGWTVATKQAVKAAKMAGNMPGGLAEHLDDALAPKVRWQEKLRRFMSSHDRSGFSWSKVNKRYLSMGYTLPSRWSSAVGEIVVAIDTSCSVSMEELSQFQSEINQILTESKPKLVTVIDCDTQINKVSKYTAQDLPLSLEVVGRGGTSFPPVFNYVKEHNMEIECLIYMTDLGASTDFEKPPYPVMWINTDKHAHTPEWGEKVDLILN